MTDQTPTSHLQSFSHAIADLVERTAPCVVAVHSHRSRASGFFWRPGLIVTADETLAEEGEIAVILQGGERVAATLVGRDPTTDVALLRTDRNLPKPKLDSANAVAAGSLAIVVGSDAGAATAALGVVSRAGDKWQSLRGGSIDARIELDANLRRSAEGGLAIEPAGGVIGMAVFGPRRRVLVIPTTTIDRVAAKLESHGRIARGYLGLALQLVRVDGGGVGAMVTSVDAKGPGVAAGVRQGDVIVAWDGQPLQGIRALLGALGPDSVGAVARLSIKRGGEPRDIELAVGERPEG
ncbi:MAG TPA: S1C family serine protease [Alphaproteobacteria bacterium]|nr:S1C family serine protease [Alphaproteobacteria bacterium]